MYLELASGGGGFLVAKYFTRDLENALAVAGRLESAGLRPNVVRSNANYVVYIAMADLLRLAERDGAIRKAIALYLAEKVKNGTQRQREIARKLLQKTPSFSILSIVSPPFRHCHVLAGDEPERRAWPICGTAEPTTTRRVRWRRGWDLNPRPLGGDGMSCTTVSSPAPWAARPPRPKATIAVNLSFSTYGNLSRFY